MTGTKERSNPEIRPGEKESIFLPGINLLAGCMHFSTSIIQTPRDLQAPKGEELYPPRCSAVECRRAQLQIQQWY